LGRIVALIVFVVGFFIRGKKSYQQARAVRRTVTALKADGAADVIRLRGASFPQVRARLGHAGETSSREATRAQPRRRPRTGPRSGWDGDRRRGARRSSAETGLALVTSGRRPR